MNILYISYWSLDEPLTTSTILVYLKFLNQHPRINHIYLATVERKKDFQHPVDLNIDRVTHIPLNTKFVYSYLITKFYEFYGLPSKLTQISKQHSIDLIVSKTSLAGSLAYLVHKKTRIPFIVESFEPHSDYMCGCGEWRKNGMRYRFAKYFEQRQLEHALKIITVTNNYKNDLIKSNKISNDRLVVIPSITNIAKFAYDPGKRSEIRAKLGLENETTAIYVGKFGALYYFDKAFYIFSKTYQEFNENLKIIILTPENPEVIRENLTAHGIPDKDTFIKYASHEEVSSYLSASDFAFATIKPAPSNKYQSPVKNGEYWANGLPILMTAGVGDEHFLMEKGLGGAVYDLEKNDLTKAILQIKTILKESSHRSEINELAHKYKSIEIAKREYHLILNSIDENCK